MADANDFSGSESASEMLSSSSSSSGGGSLSSSSAASSASEADSPDVSPRAAAAAPAPQPLLLRIPSLSLRGANLAALPRAEEDGPAGDGPTTSRRHPPPPRPGAEPRLAVPPGTRARGPADDTAVDGSLVLAMARGGAAAASPPPSSQAALLHLDMLSPAFTLGADDGGGEERTAAQRCAGRLGVPPERLRYYALTPVASLGQLPRGCSRGAVEVTDSCFSLTALEELLAENKRLAAAEKLQLEPPPQQLADLAAAQVQHLQGMLRGLQQENGALRQQLGQSESLRRKGQKALQELKQEFEALSRELMMGPSSAVAMECATAQQRECGRVQSLGTPAAVMDGLL